MRKGLAKRVGQNPDLAEETEAAVAAAVQRLEAAGRLAALPALEDVGCCAISCMDYREALQAGDCLCLGLDIERPEAAVMDPSRLVIKAITPTRISAESFMDALRFSLGQKDPEEVHGGFGGQGGRQQRGGGGGGDAGRGPCVVAGEGREAITGALPLWLCEEHWALARLLARPLLGWMTTLSPLGYSEEQLRALPFLVLSRALRDLESAPAAAGEANGGGGSGSGGGPAGAAAFCLWVADQVLATCRAVYRMRRRRILSGLLQEEEKSGEGMDVEEQEVAAAAAEEEGGEEPGAGAAADGCRQRRLAYLTGPAARTVDAVPSTEVLLGHLLCAALHSDVALSPADWERLRLAVLEKELRRCQPGGLGSGKAPLTAAALLGFDADAACAAVVARWAAAHPDSKDAAPPLAELEAAAAEPAAEVDWQCEQAALGGQPAAQRTYERRVRPLLCLLARMEALAGSAREACDGHVAASKPCWEPPASLADWLGPPSLAALLLQNGLGAKNAERRAYLEAGLYVDPFAEPEALLRRHWQEEAVAVVRESMADLRSTAYLRAATDMAGRFAAAASLQAAADAIHGWRLGRPFICRLLLAVLRQPGTLEPVGKMRLLLGRSLEERGLRGDKQRTAGSTADVNSGGGGDRDAGAAPAVAPWAPCRAAVYAFLSTHHRDLPLEDALQLFQGCCGVDRAYLEMQYAAGFDPTSPLTHRRPRRGRKRRGEGSGAGGKAGKKRGGQGYKGRRKRRTGGRQT
ncbi:hypothetical protein ABPG75_005954 [Micractinium tetrahymenae]